MLAGNLLPVVPMTAPFDDLLRLTFRSRLRAAFWAMAVAMLCHYGVQVGLARLLGVAAYGEYIYVFSWLSILVLVGKLGLDTTLQRFLPHYEIAAEWSFYRGLLVQAFSLALAGGIVLTALLALALALLGESMDAGVATAFQGGVLALPGLILVKVVQGALLAMKRPAAAQLLDGVLVPLTLLIGVYVSVEALHAVASSQLAMSWLAVATYSGLTAGGVFLLLPRLPRAVKHARSAFQLREWLAVGVSVFAISSAQLIISYTDIVMVGALVDPSAAGQYAAATRLAGLVATPLMLVNLVLPAYAAELYRAGRKDDLQSMVTYSVRASTLGASAILVVAWVTAVYLLGLFGPEFVMAETSLHILLVSQWVNVAAGSVGYLMIMTGHQRQATAVLAVAAIVNVMLNSVLIPRLGMEGAAVATASTVIAWNIALAWYLRRRTGLASSLFSSRRPG